MFDIKKIIYSVSFIILLITLFLLFHYSSILKSGLINSSLIQLGDIKYLDVNSFQSCEDSASVGFTFLKEEDVFVGIEVVLKDSVLNLSSKRNIKIDLSGTSSQFVTVCIYATALENPYDISECLLEKDLYLNRKNGIYTLNINDFSIKSWWYQANDLPIKDGLIKHDIKKILRVGVGVSNTSNIPLNKTLKISIRNIESRYALNVLAPYLIVTVIVLLITLLKDLISRKTYKLKAVTNEEFENVEENESVKSQIITFVGKHYKNHRITIQHISEISNMHHIQINEILKRHYKLSFKQYITKVRVKEAERLLKESKRSVKEISSMVGFKHVSILNRELKKSTGKTPTEIRNTY